jgi:hypothetical protein
MKKTIIFISFLLFISLGFNYYFLKYNNKKNIVNTKENIVNTKENIVNTKENIVNTKENKELVKLLHKYKKESNITNYNNI